MGLQRYAAIADPWCDGGMVPVDDGEYYRAADVGALLARIRAAVEAEREARETVADAAVGWELMQPAVAGYREARAALDALLTDGGA